MSWQFDLILILWFFLTFNCVTFAAGALAIGNEPYIMYQVTHDLNHIVTRMAKSWVSSIFILLLWKVCCEVHPSLDGGRLRHARWRWTTTKTKFLLTSSLLKSLMYIFYLRKWKWQGGGSNIAECILQCTSCVQQNAIKASSPQRWRERVKCVGAKLNTDTSGSEDRRLSRHNRRHGCEPLVSYIQTYETR